MTPSVYVKRNDSGLVYCVTKDHYEDYKDTYELLDLSAPIEPEEPEEPEVPKESAEPKKTSTRGRKAKG